MSEKTTSQESITCSSSSRNVSFSESLLQEINTFKNKNIVIITKNFEQKIPDILSFLQNNSNLAINKTQIVKYLQSLFLSIDINSEIFLRKFSYEKEKLNLYQIIIEQYIYYTNSCNFENDENDYRKELLSLFDILLSQVTMDRESYHHILSFLLRYIDEKNNKLGLKKFSNLPVEENEKEEIILTAEHLTRILTLLQRFYQFLDEIKLSMNYFFFSGDQETAITIHNKNMAKDNKKLLNLEDNLCILMFIKTFPSEYIKASLTQTNFKLIELKFNEKNKEKDISIELNSDNNLTTNLTLGPLKKLSNTRTNYLLVKFKKKKRIKLKMYLNGEKIKIEKNYKDKEKDKEKEEIKEIVLFRNFIGVCYNFMIFKTKKKEILPKFLENELKANSIREKGSIFFHGDNKKIMFGQMVRTNYYNGFINEDLLLPFIKTELKDEVDQQTLNVLYNDDESNINQNEIKDLMEKLIAIYMPTRVVIPPAYEKNTLFNSPKLILEDSLNGLDAEFVTKNPGLNGVHIFKKMIDDFSPIGGLNNLLPILEIMTQNKELLTKENLANFFDLIISIFVPQYKKALIKEKNSNFFLFLSYFFEKIPEDLYDSTLTGIFKSISSFLTNQINENDDFSEFTEQFHINILMNEKILFKFHHEEQKEILYIITNLLNNIEKRTINIDIIEVIKIILRLDEKKNNLFCCKKHSEYFTPQYEIMNPELYTRLKPIEELLNYLFFEFEEKVNNNDPSAKEAGNKLAKLFALLSYDISPCIQKMIIRLFSQFLENHFDNFFNKLDEQAQIINICLFILKISIFDIKEDILNFIFILLKNDKNDLLKLNESNYVFISNNILPFYLFEDNELIQISKNQKTEEENTETPKMVKSISQECLHKEGIENLEEKDKKDLLNEYATNIGDTGLIEEYLEKDENISPLYDKKDSQRELDIYNEIYQEDDENNSISKLNGIKINSKINDVLYYIPKFNDNLIKIHSIYNKKKLSLLINNLFNIIYKYFHEEVAIKLSLNLLTKIVSKGDLLLVSKFLNKIKEEEEINKNNRDSKIMKEIYDNQNLLQWLIETCFQTILIKGSNLDHTIFVPGFNTNVSKKDNKGNETMLNVTEKIEIINNIIKLSKFILNEIFKNNIYKMDYIFTWSKYFYELRNETNNFKSVRQLILDFMYDIGYNYCKDCTNPDISNNHEQKMTIYFFNLLFEFVTFYKLKQEDLEEYQNESIIYQELPKNLKHILVSKMDDARDTLRPIDVQEKIDSKFIEYPIFKTIFDIWTPLWKSEDKGKRQETDFYAKYIHNKKNIDINELELLFYNFKDIQIFKDDSKNNIYVNKGIPLIFILYHFFTLIFSIGGNQVEIREIFTEFRLFLLLLIISSSTLTTPGISKKRKWPSDEQYKNVQQSVEAILFNLLYFLFNKIKNTKEKISDFNEKEQNLDEEGKKYLNYLNQINRLLVENFGFFLKILNKIYKEIKKEDAKNNGGLSAVGGFFKGIKYFFFEYEGVKKSGGFKVIEKMYSECQEFFSNNDTQNCLDQITAIDFNDKEFLINTKTNVNNIEIKICNNYIQLENYINTFIENSEIEQFFEKHSEEYKKYLFPFVPYILSRRDAIKNIIPVYDNRPNLRFYQKEFFLLPDYFPNNSFESIMEKNLESVNTGLNKELKLNQTKLEIEQEYKRHNYKKEKQKLFSFTGIWSNKEFFYNKKKYKLKYRLLNHMSEDFTRVLLTPIIDVDYYLPQFGKFKTENLFRKIRDYKSVYKITDLSFDINKISPLDKDEKKGKKDNKKIKDDKNKDKKESTTLLQSSTSKEANENLNQTAVPKDMEEENKNKILQNKEEKKEDEDKDKNALYYLGKDNYSFISEKNKNDDNCIHDYLFSGFIQEKHSVQQDKYCLQASACQVRLAFHIRGIIFNNKDGIGFYSFETKRKGNEEDYDTDRKVCFGSVFRPQTAKYSHYFISIPYNKIQFILKRRYFFKRTALEIYTEDRKSYLFKIADEEKTKILIENIKYFMKQDLEGIYIEYNKFDEKIGYINKKNIFLNTNLNLLTNKKNYMNLKSLYEKWSKWEISTLKFLMIMNIYSNRTYNDINQYPVFPWIITDYTSPTIPHFEKEFFIRPMSKPMGMLDFTPDAKERKENYKDHWATNENDEDRDDNYDRYGSHYSTSLYLTYYLVRVFPYSYIRIELQGKNFDDPNRLFNSLPNSFDCAITQKSDLRELIPEFFCFPEMFLNMNELNLGEINDEKGKPKLVGGVEMPAWANKSVYTFIEKHRELLESSEINEKINEWFNIIFGSKQKGKEAKRIGNLFIKQTYEDFEETYNQSSSSEKIYQCRMVEFGVTPNQLFKNDTSKRQNLNECNKIKRKLLFHIIQKRNKNIALGKEWDLEEKQNIDENINKMFIFIVKKKDRKKERLYLLTNNKVKVYTKYDKNQLFKSSASKEKEKEKNKDIDEDINIGEILCEEEEIKDENDSEIRPNSFGNLDKHEEKLTMKEQSKMNIYAKYDKKFTVPKYRMKFSESPTLLYDEGFHIAFGGFWNGDIILKQLIEFKADTKKSKNKKVNIIKTCVLSPIIKIITDKTETIAMCYNTEGIIFIYIIDQNDKLTWHIHKIINEGQGEISSLALNEELNIFIVCFKNGYCMTYTLPNCKLYNSFRIEEYELDKNTNKDNNLSSSQIETIDSISNKIYSPGICFISQSPLPCFIFYIKERKSLCAYSINAHFLNEFYLGYEIVENGIQKYTDNFFKDYLFIYNNIKNTIDVHELTNLKLIYSSQVINYQFVDFQFTKELDYAFILVKVKQKNEDKSPTHKIMVLKQSLNDTGNK